MDRHEPDRAVARLAASQRGLVTRTQLRAVGITDRMTTRRIEAGRLHRLHRGVYLVGHADPPPLARELAVLLVAGATAALSHHTAAAVWGFLAWHGVIHFTSPDRRFRARPGLHPHHAPLSSNDTRTRHGLRLTSPGRTLRDLSPFLSPGALQRATDEAEVLGLITPPTGGPGLIRSEAERRLLDLLNRAGLPPTATNTRIEGHEVDVLYAPERLVIEMDGFAYHRTRTAQRRDHDRDAALLAHGYRVLRVGWRQVTATPEALVAAVARALA